MNRVAAITASLLLLGARGINCQIEPAKIRVRGIELHYIEQGRGEPLILLHGGAGDYRSWEPQIKAFSQYYRVISYSRRYHYPNRNPLTAQKTPAYTDADDLAALISSLDLGRVHLVGASYGALVALVLALNHPDMVRSLVLAEPPLHQWAKNAPGGAAVYAEFMTVIWRPAARSFRSGDDKWAMRILVNGFSGCARFDNLSPEALAAVMQDSESFKVLTLSSDPFPNLSRARVRRLSIPVMIVTGEHTIEIHRLVNEQLASVLTNCERAVIPNAGHGSPRENPQAFNEAVLTFLQSHREN